MPQAGLDEARYTEITHDYAVAAARTLHGHSPGCTFVLVSGAGADETGTGRAMWARVKGRAENAVLDAGFARALVFRPGAIAAKRGLRHGVRLYGLFSLLAPLMRPFGLATSTVEIGRAFVAATLGRSAGPPGKVRLDSADINALAKLAR